MKIIGSIIILLMLVIIGVLGYISIIIAMYAGTVLCGVGFVFVILATIDMWSV